MRLSIPAPAIFGSFSLLATNILVKPSVDTLFISLTLIGIGATYFIWRQWENKPEKNFLFAVVLYVFLMMALVWLRKVNL